MKKKQVVALLLAAAMTTASFMPSTGFFNIAEVQAEVVTTVIDGTLKDVNCLDDITIPDVTTVSTITYANKDFDTINDSKEVKVAVSGGSLKVTTLVSGSSVVSGDALGTSFGSLVFSVNVGNETVISQLSGDQKKVVSSSAFGTSTTVGSLTYDVTGSKLKVGSNLVVLKAGDTKIGSITAAGIVMAKDVTVSGASITATVKTNEAITVTTAGAELYYGTQKITDKTDYISGSGYTYTLYHSDKDDVNTVKFEANDWGNPIETSKNGKFDAKATSSGAYAVLINYGDELNVDTAKYVYGGRIGNESDEAAKVTASAINYVNNDQKTNKIVVSTPSYLDANNDPADAPEESTFLYDWYIVEEDENLTSAGALASKYSQKYDGLAEETGYVTGGAINMISMDHTWKDRKVAVVISSSDNTIDPCVLIGTTDFSYYFQYKSVSPGGIAQVNDNLVVSPSYIGNDAVEDLALADMDDSEKPIYRWYIVPAESGSAFDVKDPETCEEKLEASFGDKYDGDYGYLDEELDANSVQVKESMDGKIAVVVVVGDVYLVENSLAVQVSDKIVYDDGKDQSKIKAKVDATEIKQDATDKNKYSVTGRYIAADGKTEIADTDNSLKYAWFKVSTESLGAITAESFGTLDSLSKNAINTKSSLSVDSSWTESAVAVVVYDDGDESLEVKAVVRTYGVIKYQTPTKDEDGNNNNNNNNSRNNSSSRSSGSSNVSSGTTNTGSNSTTGSNTNKNNNTSSTTPTSTTPSGSTPTSNVVTNADGSKTTTTSETKADGTKVETTKTEYPDGSSVEVTKETKPDGTIIETTVEKAANGDVATTTYTISPNGTKTKKVSIVKADGSSETTTITENKDGSATIVNEVSDANGKTSIQYTLAAGASGLTVGKIETTAKKVVIPAKIAIAGGAATLKGVTTLKANTLTLEGKTIKVTKIGAAALKGNKTATKLVIGKNIKTIGKQAFMNASKVKTVNIKGNVNTVKKNAFKNINKKATIKIKATAKQFKALKKKIKAKGAAPAKVTYKRVK